MASSQGDPTAPTIAQGHSLIPRYWPLHLATGSWVTQVGAGQRATRTGTERRCRRRWDCKGTLSSGESHPAVFSSNSSVPLCPFCFLCLLQPWAGMVRDHGTLLSSPSSLWCFPEGHQWPKHKETHSAPIIPCVTVLQAAVSSPAATGKASSPPQPLCDFPQNTVSDSWSHQPVLLVHAVLSGNLSGTFPYCPQACFVLKLAFCSGFQFVCLPCSPSVVCWSSCLSPGRWL